MKTIVIATRNKDKLVEINRILSGLPFEIKSALDFPNIPEVVEDGDTLEANAIKKAQVVHEHTGLISLADDTGLEVELLNGAPGVYSSRFAGSNATYEDNVRKLLDVMKSASIDERGARFRCVIAIAGYKSEPVIVDGICPGYISSSPRGNQGFGYDPVFYLPQYDKTYAELGLDEKNRISHRGIALKNALVVLREMCDK
ncbi:MAG: XTP/dITP diphosphatase [Elusimicrobiota bacterium]